LSQVSSAAAGQIAPASAAFESDIGVGAQVLRKELSMSRRVIVGTIAAALLLAVRIDVASGAACATACKDEVAACVSTDCAGLTKRPLRQCRRRCKKSIVHDCFADLSVCGATSARPPKPGTGGSSGGGW
jgi:hypothetical protein